MQYVYCGSDRVVYCMKLIVKDGDTRRVRYGVRDFQAAESSTVHVFYPPEVAAQHDIEDGVEQLTGQVVAGEDEAEFRNDPDYELEDLAHERGEADDLKDFRL